MQIKLKRIKKRDGVSEEEVLRKINSQWSDEQKMKLTPHHILNDGKNPLNERISEVLAQLSKPI